MRSKYIIGRCIMKISDLFELASKAGVFLYLESEQLRFKLSVEKFPEDVKYLILEHKAEIIAFLSEQDSNSNSFEIPEISKKSDRKKNVTLSFSQQRMWFIDSLQGGSSEYNMPMAFAVSGLLNIELLTHVFSTIIARHEVLRTVYIQEKGQTLQYIRSMSDIYFEVIEDDLTHLTGETLALNVKSLVEADITSQFNLAKDVMLRVGYVKKSADTGVLIFNMHHIASDGWSMEVLTKEFFALYHAYSQGQTSPLQPLAIQYVDYAHWQQEYLKGERLESQLSYWEKQLDGVPAIHSISLDYVRPVTKQHQGAEVIGVLSDNIAQQLLNVAKDYELTPFMLLHGALSLLLSRHSDTHDIVIGTPVANRLQPELEPLIGFFVNTLVLRVDTHHDTLIDYFTHIKQVHLGAQSNQDVPFEQLVERLNVPRSTAHSPLFQIMMTTSTDYGLNNQSEIESFKLPGVELKPYHSGLFLAKFDLNVDLSISEQGVGLKWIYDVSLFTESHISQLNAHLCHLLEELSKTKGQSIQAPHALPMLSDNQTHYLVNELNYTDMNQDEQKVQNLDLLVWLRTWLAQAENSSQVAYWQKQLEQLPPVHNLSLDYERTDVKKWAGGTYISLLDTERSDMLIRIANQYTLTPFMLAHAVFSLVVSRFSNSNDIVMGTPVPNRMRSERHPMVGSLVNSLVLRSSTEFDTLEEYFAHIREVHVGAQNNQDIPFEYLVDKLNVPRLTSYTPIFQLVISSSIDQLATANILTHDGDPSVEYLDAGIVQAKFDIELCADYTTEGLRQTWVYDRSIFSEETIKKLDDAIFHVYEFLLTIPENKISSSTLLSVPTLSKEEFSFVFDDYNNTSKDLGEFKLLHEPFISQVRKNANSISVIDKHGEYTYGEVFNAAENLAELLKSKGIIAQDFVAIRQPKGVSQVVSALAIMFCGAAYLPIETSWPEERCSRILAKSNCSLVLVENADDAIAEVVSIKVTRSFETLNTTPVQTRAAKFELVPKATDLAYVIFTSGSTGEPKGVAIEHQSAINTILDINQRYAVTGNDKVLAVSALSFDLSVYDIFGALAAGAKVVFPDSDKGADPEYWRSLVDKYNISIWNSVPAATFLLTEQYQLTQSSNSTLKVIMMSGDWIDPKLPSELNLRFPNANIHSLGGATEGSIWSITYPITEDTRGYKSVPYGRPLANQGFYIVNQDNSLTPIGCIGELCIGGIGVAREYFADPEKTARQFVYHPTIAGRVYKTGDLGCYLADGNIQFIGRVDAQVKLNGYRIELGEVEKKITDIPEVDSCFVKLVEDKSGTKSLAAYVLSPLDSASITPEYIRGAISASLPSYMVPSYFVVMDRWPLTANNKIDFKSLAKPELSKKVREIVKPENDTQERLLGLYSNMLGRDEAELSIEDSFFELNGNSLLAARLIFNVCAEFDIKVELIDFYQNSSIADISQIVSRLTMIHDANNNSLSDVVEVEEFLV